MNKSLFPKGLLPVEHQIRQFCDSKKPPDIVGPRAVCLFSHNWEKTMFYNDFDITSLQNLVFSAWK